MNWLAPPWLAERLLRWLRRSPDTPYLAGDLAEGFAHRAAISLSEARRWYWTQVLRALWHRTPSTIQEAHSDGGQGQGVGDEGLLTKRAAALLRELAAARRVITRRPGPAIVAIATTALAVTATATLLSVTYSVLFRPLPWPNADRLIQAWETRGGSSVADRFLTSGTLEAWRDGAATVKELAAYRETTYTVAGRDGAERVPGAAVSPNLLGMLGAVPSFGGTLRPDARGTVIVSEPFARRLFGDDQNWVGRTLNLDGGSYTVVGVLPASFGFPAPDTCVWVALERPRSESLAIFKVLGTLADTATPEQAAIEAGARAQQAPPIAPAVQRMLFGAEGPPRLHAASLLDVETSHVRPALLASLVGITLLLLAALVSLVGLQLARATERRQEFAIRAAIGGSRARLAALLVGETLWLSLAGGSIALFLTRWTLGLAPRLLPADFPRIGALSFDLVSFLAVVMTAAVVGLVVGFIPSWRVTRVNLAASIAGGPRTFAASEVGIFTVGRSRHVLPAIEIAVAVMLLVGAGLLCRTLNELLREDLGYAPKGVVIARIIGTGSSRARGAGLIDADTLQRLIVRLGQLPQVTGVALSTALPFQTSSGRLNVAFTLPSVDGSGREVPAPASKNDVTPTYFRIVGMRVIAGRALTDQDYGRATRALVVNKTFARTYLGENPIGSLVHGGEVVGIVEDIKDRGPREPVDPQMFSLYDTSQGTPLVRPSAVFLQTSADLDAIVPLARALVHEVDNRLGLDEVTTIQASLSAMIAEPRLYATVAAVSAAFVLVVAAVGLFGVLWHSVTSRTREIGVRSALGATPARIARQVLREGLAVAAVGSAAGLMTAALLVRYLASFLFRVAPYDVLVFTLAPAVLMIIALVACLIPARRAAAIDPIHALRAL